MPILKSIILQDDTIKSGTPATNISQGDIVKAQ